MHAGKYFILLLKKKKPKIVSTAYKLGYVSCTGFLDILTLLMLFPASSEVLMVPLSYSAAEGCIVICKFLKDWESEIMLCCNEYFLIRFNLFPSSTHINDGVLMLSRVKHLQFLDSRSTYYLNAMRYLKHSKSIKKNMGVIMRNVCLLPTGGIWDSSEEVALNNSATFLQSLWHELSFSWEIA